MTQSQLNEIKSRHQAVLPKTDGMRDRMMMEYTPETPVARASVRYDDGDLCAEVHGNLGLDIDGDAVAEFFAHSMRDVDAMLEYIAELKNALAGIRETCPVGPKNMDEDFWIAWQKMKSMLEP